MGDEEGGGYGGVVYRGLRDLTGEERYEQDELAKEWRARGAQEGYGRGEWRG